MYKKTFHGGVHPYDGKNLHVTFRFRPGFQRGIWFSI